MRPHLAQTQTPSAISPTRPRRDAALAREMTRLRTEFSSFRIWREAVGDRVRYVARRTHAGAHPHTVVAADPAELRSALLAGQGQECRLAENTAAPKWDACAAVPTKVEH